MVSSDVELAHSILKDKRTKDRNRLTYENNAAIFFGKLELMHGRKPSPRLEWKDMVEFHKALHSLSDEEEVWVDKLLKEWEATEEEEAAKHGSAQTQGQGGTVPDVAGTDTQASYTIT